MWDSTWPAIQNYCVDKQLQGKRIRDKPLKLQEQTLSRGLRCWDKWETPRYSMRASAEGQLKTGLNATAAQTHWHLCCCSVFESHMTRGKSQSFRLVLWTVSLCSRVSASSGDTAEGMAPPRGGDCNFLKPLSLKLELVHLPSSQPPPENAHQQIQNWVTDWGDPCPENELEVTNLGNWNRYI